MNDRAQTALCLEARDMLRRRVRLTRAHHEAVVASAIPDDAKAKMLEAHRALTVAAAQAGKRLTAWDRECLRREAPDQAEAVLAKDRADIDAKNSYRRAGQISVQELGDLPQPADQARRSAALASFRAFLETYFYGPDQRFYAPFSADHIKVVSLAQQAVETGQSCCVAMPRGSGKTSIIELAPLWAIFRGQWQFACIIAANRGRAVDILTSIKTTLTTNELLCADFPEFCQPLRHIEGEPRRCIGQRYHGKRTGIEWAPDHIRFASIPDRGVQGAIFWASGMTAQLRGLRRTLADGSLVRPDACVLDDPQTDKSAASPTQTEARLSIIRGTIRYWPAPGKRLPVLACVTVVQQGDLAEQLLDPKQSGWQIVRTKSLYSMPADMDHWHKYRELRREDAALGQTGTAAAYYAANREAMDAGAVLAWPDRPVSAGYASALQELMDAHLDDPDKFAAEHQQEPRPREAVTSAVDANKLARKVNGRKRGEVPPECPFLVAFIDSHDRALYWAVAAFSATAQPFVVDYGTWPEQPTRDFRLDAIKHTLRRKYSGRALDAALYAGMDELVSDLEGRRYRRGEAEAAIDRILADTGYRLDLWQQVKAKHDRLTLTRGVGIKAGNRPMLEWQRRPGEIVGDHWLMPPASRREFPVAQIDVNHWKSTLADSLASPVGESGALTIFGDQRTAHVLLAQHLTAEYPVETEGYGRRVTEWRLMPGRDNHWLDCVVGCLVGASMLGARPAGAPCVQPRGRMRRRYTQADLLNRRGYATKR